MDEPWAIDQLQRFIYLTELVAPPPMPSGMFIAGDRRPTRANNSDILPVAQVVEKILDRVLPTWRADLSPAKRWQQHRAAAIRAIAELETRAEVAARLGDDAPTLSAAALHPWVWQAARSLWQSRHCRGCPGSRREAQRRDAEQGRPSGRV